MSEGLTEDTLRFCSCCAEPKPLAAFYTRTCGGPFSQCKSCYRDRQGTKQAPEKKDSLYILGCSMMPGILKVGRSADPQARAKEIQASQPYFAQLVAVFPQKGHIEAVVHARLAKRRVEAPGREWFHAPLSEVLQIVSEHLD